MENQLIVFINEHSQEVFQFAILNVIRHQPHADSNLVECRFSDKPPSRRTFRKTANTNIAKSIRYALPAVEERFVGI